MSFANMTVSMKKSWLGLALCVSLSFPASALAADRTVVGVGTGAVAGAVVGGPIGAVVGAVAGGFIGANSGEARPRYRRRARVGVRRRIAEPPAPERTRLASRTASAPNAIRPASAAQPAPPPRPSASEVETTTGSTAARWKDPR